MTITLYWAFNIFVFMATSGAGASCGISSSPEYRDETECETARGKYEETLIPYQTATRRASTEKCTLRVRKDP